MSIGPRTNERSQRESEVVDGFLDSPSERSFEELFRTFTPQLVALLRSRRCELSLAEDLAQEVMLTVYRKAGQLKERRCFRGWLFKIALNEMRRYHSNNKPHQEETIDLAILKDRPITQESHKPAGSPAFEFLHWMTLLDSRESEAMKLRFIEQWEYHEIAASQAIPVGTVQWRIFNAKKKLRPFLSVRRERMTKAA